MKHWPAIFFAVAFGLFVCGCQTLAPKTRATTSVPSVAGTTWSGKDSDGDFFEYTFLKDGHLKYRTNTQRTHIVTFQDATDTWTQNGDTVTLKVNRFSTDVGTIHGNTMTGKGGNIEGRHWTWTFTRKSL